MNNKLTAIKIKKPDGTYSEQILISVLAQNVKYDSTRNLNDILNLLDHRIDQIVTPTSSTLTLDEEVRDIREGYDGTRYDGAGVAVRTQIANLANSMVEVDNTLTIQGTAADAKKTGNEIVDLRRTIENATNIKYYDWVEGRIDVKTLPISLDVDTSIDGWLHIIVPCQAGDQFSITSSHVNSQYRPWTFLNENNEISDQSTSTSETDRVITAPDDAVKLVCNATFSYEHILKSGFISGNLKSVADKINESDFQIQVNRDIINRVGPCYIPIWEQGNLTSTEGETLSSNLIRTSDYLEVPNGKSVTVFFDSNLYSARAVVFNSPNMLSGKVNYIFSETVKTYVNTSGVTKYLRFRFGHSPAEKTSPNEGYLNFKIIKNWIEETIPKTNQIESFRHFNRGYAINLRYSTTNINEPLPDNNYGYTIIPCSPLDRFIVQAWTFGAVAITWGFVSANGEIKLKADQNSQGDIIYRQDIITAPNDTVCLVVNHRYYDSSGNTHSYDPVVYKIPSNDEQETYIAMMSGLLPYFETDNYKRYTIARYDQYVASYMNDKIYISVDGGKNYPHEIDVSNFETILQGHFFASGTLTFFTATKAYYTSDYVNISESTLYNSDGTIYEPAAKYNFNIACDSPTRKFINGVDMFVFGNYTLSSSIKALLWYSIDEGHTYKVAYEFGTGDNYKVRHTHEVYYYEPEDVFILMSGDSATAECNIFSCLYDVSNDTWTIDKIAGSSKTFKWSSLDVWDGWIYYAHDITPGEVNRCKFEDLGDVSKHEIILQDLPNDVTGVFIGPAGDMLVTLSTYRSSAGQESSATLPAKTCARKLYYSSDRKSFAELLMPPCTLIGSSTLFWFSKTQDGHIIGKTWADNNHDVIGPGLYLDDVIRASGYPRAFLPI